MTLYLTDMTTPEEIQAAKDSGIIYGIKYYPAGATTNSEFGVTDLKRTYPTLQRMSDLSVPLLCHGEVTDATCDVFEREPVFVEHSLRALVSAFPRLKIVLEHITTKEAVAFVKECGPNVAATITAHHLLYNRNALFEGGVRPHRYCLPILKHESDRLALVQAVVSRNPKFFAGTDSAPHSKAAKECACGAAGMFTAHAPLELYALVLMRVDALDALEGFACRFGADFYGLPHNASVHTGVRVEIRSDPWLVPVTFELGPGAEVVPVMAGEVMPIKAVVVRS